jgi:hypothetical protein
MLTGPIGPRITTPPNGIRDQVNIAGPPPISLSGPLGSLLNPILDPVQSLAAGLISPLAGAFGNRGNPKSGNSKGGSGNHPPSFLSGHTKCSAQEVSCSFLREAAYQMQNDDDRCLKIATSFDQEGKIKFDPIVQDSDNVIYGITTDGLTASAWCNDIGWALRKIYNSCRRGKQCFGGKCRHTSLRFNSNL